MLSFLAALILLSGAVITVTRSGRLLIVCFCGQTFLSAVYVFFADGSFYFKAPASLLILTGLVVGARLLVPRLAPDLSQYFEIRMKRGIMSTACALMVAAPFALLPPGAQSAHSSFPYSVAVVLLGILTIATHKDRVAQAIGLITVENGVFLAGVPLAGEEQFSWFLFTLSAAGYTFLTLISLWILLSRAETSEASKVS